MASLFLPDGLDEDILRLLKFSDEHLGALRDLLDSDRAAESAYKLGMTFSATTGIPSFEAYRLIQLVRYLDRQKEESEATEQEVLDELKVAFPECAEAIDEHSEILRVLLQSKPRGDLCRKKYRLGHGPIRSLVSVWGACDLRPVFDPQREKVVDHIRVILARISLEDDRGEDETFTFQMDEDSLDKLEEFIRLTRKKLSAMDLAIEVKHVTS